MAAKKLTKRQQKFVEAVTDPNVKSDTEAAKRAGYSPKTAGSIANENLKKPEIFEAIQKRKERLAELAQVTDQQILGATAEIAFASIEDALDDNGYLDIAKAKQNGSISLIKKITRNPTKYGETVSIEFYPKDAAQARLAEYRGMKQQDRPNTEDVELKQLQAGLKVLAERMGTTYEYELKTMLDLYPTKIRADIRDRLASELVN